MQVKFTPATAAVAVALSGNAGILTAVVVCVCVVVVVSEIVCKEQMRKTTKLERKKTKKNHTKITIIIQKQNSWLKIDVV